MPKGRASIGMGAAIVLAALAHCSIAFAQDASEFWKGKTVSIEVGTSAGGGYDA